MDETINDDPKSKHALKSINIHSEAVDYVNDINNENALVIINTVEPLLTDTPEWRTASL